MKMIANGFEQVWNSVPAAANEGAIHKYFNRFSTRNQIVKLLICWFDRIESRRHLARLDERLLKDIGLNSYQVQQETSKAFWQA